LSFVSLLLGLLLQAAPASGSLQGFVVRAGTNPPAVLVNARLELSHSSGVAIARTDSTGRFVFSGLPPGYFGLRVTKDGYIRQEYRLPLVLTPGQGLQDIVFRMEPAPTISGFIRDETEARISGVVVQAMKRVFDRQGNPALSLIASAVTDDRGTFRLYWLDPGEYLISATPPPTLTPPPAGTGLPQTTAKRIAWAPTYFPGYVDPDNAKPVRLDVARDASGMDFKLIRQTTVTLSGFAASNASGPVTADIRIVPPEDSEGVARYSGKSSTPTGSYAIDGVAPGSYIVSATAAGGAETTSTRIRIRDMSLRVDLRLGEGIAVRGRVSNSTESSMDLRNARIHLSEIDPSLPEPAAVKIGADNQFSVAAVQPGNYAVAVNGLADDLYMKSAVYGSADVLERPLSVNYGPQSELGIEIGLDGGRINGAVFDRDNGLFPGAQVILVPVSVSRFRFDRYRTAVAGADGQFTVRGIAPGDYKVFAWESLEPNAYLNTDYMRPYEEFGMPVRIEPNGSASVSLRVIPAP